MIPIRYKVKAPSLSVYCLSCRTLTGSLHPRFFFLSLDKVLLAILSYLPRNKKCVYTISRCRYIYIAFLLLLPKVFFFSAQKQWRLYKYERYRVSGTKRPKQKIWLRVSISRITTVQSLFSQRGFTAAAKPNVGFPLFLPMISTCDDKHPPPSIRHRDLYHTPRVVKDNHLSGRVDLSTSRRVEPKKKRKSYFSRRRPRHWLGATKSKQKTPPSNSQAHIIRSKQQNPCCYIITSVFYT